MKIKNIKIGTRIRQSPEGIKELAENIQQIGLIHPISVDSSGYLLCGLRRLEACKSLGWEEIEARIFPIDIEADENLFRQDFTPEEKVKGLERIEARERQKAKERELAGVKIDPVEIFPQGKTRDIVAKKVGWSGRTYDKAKAVIDSGQQKLIDMMNRQKKVNTAYRYLKQKEDEKKILKEQPSLEAKEKFKTILIDPPWQYDTNVLGRTQPEYTTMSIEKLKEIKLPADENCHLYLWTTNAFLLKALELGKHWGFEYKTCITWIKPSIGMGSYFRNSTEHCLFFVKGRLSTRVKNIPTHFEAKRRKHSEKPEEMYEIIERASYPPYIEIFGRRKREKWIVKGNL